MKKHFFSQLSVYKGFTLIEVLISVIILAIGILGTIAMQARALNDNQDAYMRTQANFLAYDLSDRIRANAIGWTVIPDPANIACDTAVANCTPVDMAQSDYWNWQQQITNTLTDGVGEVVIQGLGVMCSGASANGVLVKITWQRSNSDANSRLGRACYSLDVLVGS